MSKVDGDDIGARGDAVVCGAEEADSGEAPAPAAEVGNGTKGRGRRMGQAGKRRGTGWEQGGSGRSQGEGRGWGGRARRRGAPWQFRAAPQCRDPKLSLFLPAETRKKKKKNPAQIWPIYEFR